MLLLTYSIPTVIDHSYSRLSETLQFISFLVLCLIKFCVCLFGFVFDQLRNFETNLTPDPRTASEKRATTKRNMPQKRQELSKLEHATGYDNREGKTRENESASVTENTLQTKKHARDAWNMWTCTCHITQRHTNTFLSLSLSLSPQTDWTYALAMALSAANRSPGTNKSRR